jgi:hypothetical protein
VKHDWFLFHCQSRRLCLSIVTKLNDIEWNLFDVKAIDHIHTMHLPVVTMKFNYDDRTEKQSKSTSFSINAEQFAVLLAGR